jgi:colicin import membrane protein
MTDNLDPGSQQLATHPQTLQQHALQEIDQVGEGLAALAAKYQSAVFDVTSGKGMAEAKAARAEIRDVRYKVENIRKATGSELKRIASMVNDRAKEITAPILALEDPIDKQIKAEEDRKEAEREARRQAEAAKLAEQNARLDAIRNTPLAAVGANAAEIQSAIEKLEADDLAGFDDVFRPTAEQTKASALDTLTRLLTERRQLDEQAAELERQRAERAAREAEEAEARRQQQEREEAERRERQRLEDEERAARQAEEDRQRAEQAERDRAAREAEEARLAEERRQLETAQAAQRAAEEKVAQEAAEAAQRAEAERLAKEQAEAAEREQARLAAEQEAIDKATLVEAAREAAEYLRGLDDAADLISRKLDAAIARAEAPLADPAA